MRSSVLRRQAAFALLISSSTACVRAASPAPCSAPKAEVPSPPLEGSPGWLDRASLNASEPLALHDIQWVLKAADDSQEAVVPAALHTFTHGRWECALSEERSADVFAAPRLTVARERRLVCTHASGITVQTELSCGYEAPSHASQGAPSAVKRDNELVLADAPALTWSCRTAQVERLEVRNQDGVAQALCVFEGRAIAPCVEGG